MGCVESNPIVKWVQRKIGSDINFFRLDLRTGSGKEVMAKFNISLNSAYLIFDQSGKEIWRSYAVPLNGSK
ncbi:hypothetical protein IH785_10845, partial [candidate division KSB1 bacterium]|nr:hypothetical protein [candidate division KSB1 bacterium]